jgi:hypothetical protein
MLYLSSARGEFGADALQINALSKAPRLSKAGVSCVLSANRITSLFRLHARRLVEAGAPSK